MPVVTALEVVPGRAGRVAVHVDGSLLAELELNTVQDLGLYRGRELDEAQLQALQTEARLGPALAMALRFLSFRARSEQEIRRRLTRGKVEPEVQERVLARLRRDGLIDDAEFARQWVDNRLTFSPRGAHLLAAELRQRGVEKPLVEEALTALPDETETALELGRARLRQLRGLDYRQFRGKLAGFLLRRGYDYHIADEVVKTLWQEKHEALPDEAAQD